MSSSVTISGSVSAAVVAVGDSTIEVHPKLSEALHVKSSTPLPGN